MKTNKGNVFLNFENQINIFFKILNILLKNLFSR